MASQAGSLGVSPVSGSDSGAEQAQTAGLLPAQLKPEDGHQGLPPGTGWHGGLQDADLQLAAVSTLMGVDPFPVEHTMAVRTPLKGGSSFPQRRMFGRRH